MPDVDVRTRHDRRQPFEQLFDRSCRELGPDCVLAVSSILVGNPSVCNTILKWRGKGLAYVRCTSYQKCAITCWVVFWFWFTSVAFDFINYKRTCDIQFVYSSWNRVETLSENMECECAPVFFMPGLKLCWYCYSSVYYIWSVIFAVLSKEITIKVIGANRVERCALIEFMAIDSWGSPQNPQRSAQSIRKFCARISEKMNDWTSSQQRTNTWLSIYRWDFIRYIKLCVVTTAQLWANDFLEWMTNFSKTIITSF